MNMNPVLWRLDVRSVERALPFWTKGLPKPLVDLSRIRAFDVFGVLLLALLGRQCEEQGGFLRILLPKDEEIAKELVSTGLFSHLTKAWVDRPLPEPGKRFVLVARAREEKEIKGLVDEMCDRLLARFPLAENAVRILATALFELFENIHYHANPHGDVEPFGIGGLEELSDHIHVAVLDKGVGLRGSLATNPKYRGLEDAEALEAVLVEGVSRFDRPGRGGTLKRIREVVLRNGGKFYVRSMEGAFLQEDVEWTVGKVHPFPGVQVSIRLPKTIFT